jgi:predicted glycosyltransferase
MNIAKVKARRNELLFMLEKSQNVTKSISEQISDIESLIDSASEIKVGRVLDLDDIQVNDTYFCWSHTIVRKMTYLEKEIDKKIFSIGGMFHDEKSCTSFMLELQTQQLTRMAINKRIDIEDKVANQVNFMYGEC